MKTFRLFGAAILLGLVALFQSCDDNDGYSIGDIGVDYVTIHVSGNGDYSFTGDTWGTMWPDAPSILGFTPVDGQRALLYFNPLYDDFQGYDVAIKVENIYPILTKQVEVLNAENEEEYGDDPARITDAWISGGYMNMIFYQDIPMQKPHRVSLVENKEKDYEDDGYIHLEYRYNTYGDTLSNRKIRSSVCYNLNTLDIKNKKGIKMRINSAVNGERVLTFDASYQALPEDAKNLDLANSYAK